MLRTQSHAQHQVLFHQLTGTSAVLESEGQAAARGPLGCLEHSARPSLLAPCWHGAQSPASARPRTGSIGWHKDIFSGVPVRAFKDSLRCLSETKEPISLEMPKDREYSALSRGGLHTPPVQPRPLGQPRHTCQPGVQDHVSQQADHCVQAFRVSRHSIHGGVSGKTQCQALRSQQTQASRDVFIDLH